jgi:hypothetical protein
MLRKLSDSTLITVIGYIFLMMVIWIPFGINDITGGEEWAALAGLESPIQISNSSRPLVRFSESQNRAKQTQK